MRLLLLPGLAGGGGSRERGGGGASRTTGERGRKRGQERFFPGPNVGMIHSKRTNTMGPSREPPPEQRTSPVPPIRSDLANTKH